MEEFAAALEWIDKCCICYTAIDELGSVEQVAGRGHAASSESIPSAIGPDTPLRLDVAAEVAYPDGSMTASGLRNEIRKGRLQCERTAGKQYVTLSDIERMRQQCRDKPKVPASTAANAAVANQFGSSSTEQLKSAQVAALAIADELKKRYHLLNGLLFDDAGHRMAPTHATKAGIRYRYYVSRPCLHGETKTAKVGSTTRVPAGEIEDIIVKSLNEHLTSQIGMPTSAITGRSAIAELIDRIDVHRDRLAVRLRSRESSAATELANDIQPTDDRVLSIPWQKPPFKRSGNSCCLMGHHERSPGRSGRNDAAAWSAPSREAIAGSTKSSQGNVTDVEQIALREQCSVRHVNMTISLAFLAPRLVRAAVEGRLPRGINIERLRDAPAQWSRQFEALGLNRHNSGAPNVPPGQFPRSGLLRDRM